ncbi:MAG: UDP-N-acetylmuramate--L-alanine ligase [Firmicutes bacterium]|nr:UDP-N-acetylmuramate--L-alanine ligase [Bacillota bacterium]MDI6705060.1 UDP-N-acetylmuramate--L-alanine ligase [Bacillota bacterium]
MLLDLIDNRKLYIHFVGIGGISMSGIAHILLQRGCKVSGSDNNLSNITEKLEKEGATVYKGHSKEHISNPDFIVYTSAVSDDNPELVAAREKGIPVVDRATILGKLMEEYEYSIAVAGAHGKTTTTSMISLIFNNAKLDPTLLIGGELEQIGGNVRTGRSPFLVTEACEYKENFLKFRPYAEVILNIDADHLDYFKNLEHIKAAFSNFARLVPKHGWLVLFHEDPNLLDISHTLSCNVITYGFEEGAQVRAENISFDNRGCPSFELVYRGKNLGRIGLTIPGRHNILNALAAASVSLIFDIDFNTIKDTLGMFTGTHRRFEIKGNYEGAIIVDDYAHHPAEIRATLEAASNYPHNKMWCVFQPHTYTRTKFLLDDFAESFYQADKIIVADIYAAREKDTGEIHSTNLVNEIKSKGKDAVYIPDFTGIVRYLADNITEGDLVLTVGAGNIYQVGEMLLSRNF